MFIYKHLVYTSAISSMLIIVLCIYMYLCVSLLYVYTYFYTRALYHVMFNLQLSHSSFSFLTAITAHERPLESSWALWFLLQSRLGFSPGRWFHLLMVPNHLQDFVGDLELYRSTLTE